MTPVPVTTAEVALKVVGTRPAEVIDAIAALAGSGGEPHLVGSLAAGLGDHRSDIDVHIVSGDDAPAERPVLAFTAAGTCIDVRYLRRCVIDRVLRAPSPGHRVRPAGRADAWMLSRWLNALPLHDGAPPLLDGAQRDRASKLIIMSLTADLTTLAAFATLAEHAGADRAWYLCRRAATTAWELAAALSGQDYLGERWLPARSADPDVAAFAGLAGAVRRADDLGPLLGRLGIAAAQAPGRVRLRANPEAEQWTLGGERLLLVAGRRLVTPVRPVPETVAAALAPDPAPAQVFAGLVNGALRWSVDVSGMSPSLAAGRAANR